MGFVWIGWNEYGMPFLCQPRWNIWHSKGCLLLVFVDCESEKALKLCLPNFQAPPDICSTTELDSVLPWSHTHLHVQLSSIWVVPPSALIYKLHQWFHFASICESISISWACQSHEKQNHTHMISWSQTSCSTVSRALRGWMILYSSNRSESFKAIDCKSLYKSQNALSSSLLLGSLSSWDTYLCSSLLRCPLQSSTSLSQLEYNICS